MVQKITEQITGEQVANWLLIALLVVYFIYKEWPDFYRRITGKALEKAADAVQDKSIDSRLTAIEADLKQIREKLERDYIRLNDMERWRTSMQKLMADSLEEREILMQALLGVLGGLQEIGANGPTKDAEKTIRQYLNKKAHSPDD